MISHVKSTAAQTSSSLLALTTLSLLVPAAFNAVGAEAREAELGILNLSHGTALVLLVVYALSLLFQVRKYDHFSRFDRYLFEGNF